MREMWATGLKKTAENEGKAGRSTRQRPRRPIKRWNKTHCASREREKNSLLILSLSSYQPCWLYICVQVCVFASTSRIQHGVKHGPCAPVKDGFHLVELGGSDAQKHSGVFVCVCVWSHHTTWVGFNLRISSYTSLPVPQTTSFSGAFCIATQYASSRHLVFPLYARSLPCC